LGVDILVDVNGQLVFNEEVIDGYDVIFGLV
jgi:hypothetical protein